MRLMYRYKAFNPDFGTLLTGMNSQVCLEFTVILELGKKDPACAN
jgi:hypothetical protein